LYHGLLKYYHKSNSINAQSILSTSASLADGEISTSENKNNGATKTTIQKRKKGFQPKPVSSGPLISSEAHVQKKQRGLQNPDTLVTPRKSHQHGFKSTMPSGPLSEKRTSKSKLNDL
jgi:hypothetical protein